MTHFAQSYCIFSKIIPWLLDELQICRPPSPKGILHTRLMGANMETFTVQTVILKSLTVEYFHVRGLTHRLSPSSVPANSLWNIQTITTKGHTAAHDRCCKCYMYTAQLLAKTAPPTATSCFFKKLDRCEVFLGSNTLMNVNWQKATFCCIDTLHVSRTYCRSGIRPLRAATTDLVDCVIDW